MYNSKLYEHFLLLAFTLSRCISISAFASFHGILVGINNSAIEIKICAVAAGIKKV